MNFLQQMVNAILGEEFPDLLQSVDPNILFLACLFMLYFAYLALRSLVRTFISRPLW